MAMVCSFAELKPSHFARAGGKATALARLLQAGFPVPRGFVLLTDAFESFLRANDLTDRISKSLARIAVNGDRSISSTSSEITMSICSSEIPSDILDEVRCHFGLLNAQRVAVRSSATAEDTTTAAWAGQLETYLNTRVSDLVANIRACWASLYAPRALFYGLRQNLIERPLSIAVIVQEMVDSDASGTLFTTSPTKPRSDEVLIEATFGLGEGLASGQITPDSYVVEKNARHVVSKEIRNKTRALFSDPTDNRQEKQWRHVSPHLSKTSVLSDRQIFELADYGLRIERHFGFPCDIEWAIKAGTFYILQSRPITASSAPAAIFQKTFARDFCLIALEVAYRGETSSKPWIQGPSNPHLPYLLFERANGTIYVWFNKDGADWTNASLKKRALNDPDFQQLVKNNVLRSIAPIRPLYENPKPLPDDKFHQFVNDYTEAYPWLDAMWRLASMTDEELGARNVLVDLRKRTERLSSGSDATIRQSLEAKFPQLGALSAMISYEELTKNTIPNRNVLQQRSDNFIYIDNKLHAGLTKEIAARQFSIRFNDEQLPAGVSQLSGISASSGKARGLVRKIMGHGDFGTILPGEILVSPMTMPDFIQEMSKAAAIVTDEGGSTSHAAITAREMNKPCIVGTIFATQILNTGDMVEVDADAGTVRKLLQS